LDSIDTGLPSMDSKDVEDIFKGVLTDDSHSSPDIMFPLNSGLCAPQHLPSSTPTQMSSNIHSPTVMISQNIGSSGKWRVEYGIIINYCNARLKHKNDLPQCKEVQDCLEVHFNQM